MNKTKKASAVSNKITLAQVESIKHGLLGVGASTKAERAPMLSELAKMPGSSRKPRPAFQRQLTVPGYEDAPKICVLPNSDEGHLQVPTIQVQVENAMGPESKKSQFSRNQDSIFRLTGLKMQRSFRFPKKASAAEEHKTRAESPQEAAHPQQQQSKVRKMKAALETALTQHSRPKPGLLSLPGAKGISASLTASPALNPDPLQKTIKRFLQIESKLSPPSPKPAVNPIIYIPASVQEEPAAEENSSTAESMRPPEPVVRRPRANFTRSDEWRVWRGSGSPAATAVLSSLGTMGVPKLQRRSDVPTFSMVSVWEKSLFV